MGSLSATVILMVLAHEFQHGSAFSFIARNSPLTSTRVPFRPQLLLDVSPLTNQSRRRSTSTMRHSILEDANCAAEADEYGKQREARFPKWVSSSTSSRRRAVVKSLLQRCDTFRAAGISDPSNPPLVAGGKTNAILFFLAFGYKCYRSVVINKMAIWERQPQWNTVMTSREMEVKADLKAMTCKTCGTTIFIAKGRKWFQMPKGYECYGCGAVGTDNFVNVRDELLDEIEDDYFDYEKPLDFVTAAERKALMKQAGGDEAKAIALLQGGTNEEVAAAEGDGSGEVKKTKKKGKKKKKKKKKKKIATDDISSEERVDAQVTSSTSDGDGDGDGDINDTSDESPTNDEKKSSDDLLDDLDMDNF